MDGRLTLVDESRFREELADIMEGVERDYRQLAARQRPAISYLLEANKNLKKAKLGVSRLVGDSQE
jgi:hypothetical protein